MVDSCLSSTKSWDQVQTLVSKKKKERKREKQFKEYKQNTKSTLETFRLYITLKASEYIFMYGQPLKYNGK
jgi:ribosomal protein L9